MNRLQRWEREQVTIRSRLKKLVLREATVHAEGGSMHKLWVAEWGGWAGPMHAIAGQGLLGRQSTGTTKANQATSNMY